MTTWPADRVERRAIDKLIPYARNARLHSDAQVAQIAASIREWGWTIPVLVDEHDGIIAGHGRVLAARKLEISDVPVIVARGWSETQKRAYVIADNKLTLNGEWSNDLLKIELEQLGELGFDMSLTGFNDAEFAQLLGADSAADAASEWQGMPEFTQDDLMAHRTIKVHFRDDQAVAEFAKLLRQQVTDKTRFLWFPPAARDAVADKEYSV